MTDICKQLFALNKISNKSVSLYHKFALSVGISDSALGVLHALAAAQEPCSQQGLCNELSLPKQTVNSTVSALQKRNLVALSQAAGARNKKNLYLTATGKQFAEQTVGMLLEAECAALCELSEAERELFVQLNLKYNQTLTEKLSALLDVAQN